MNRRGVIKELALTTVWVTPLVSSVLIPIHAQTSPPCLSEPPFGLLITVLDDSSGLNVACQAEGTITEAGYSAALRHYHPFFPPQTTCDSLTLGGAINRPGIYAISIDAPGYVTYKQDNIIVAIAACYTEQIKMQIRLKRL